MQAQRQEAWQPDPGQEPSGFEHVVMEAGAEPGEQGAAQDGATLATHYVDSPFHGYTTELSLLAGHYLRVRCSHADGSWGDYSFDLGFLGAGHTRARHIPWAGFALVAALVAAGAGTMALAWARHESWTHPFLLGLVGCVVVVLGTFALVSFLRRTTETLELRSLHGQAPLARLTGGLGSARRLTALVCDLAKGAKAARAARPRERRQFLREEMRAHHGLHQSGVLSAEEYESSKALILAAHDEAATPQG
jgi:hypothetical protein